MEFTTLVIVNIEILKKQQQPASLRKDKEFCTYTQSLNLKFILESALLQFT